MQPRRIARELALLSVSQLSNKPEKLAEQDLQDVLIAAIRTLAGEVQDTLEMAAAELKRSSDRLLNSELRAIEVESARAMVNEAISLTQTAVNRLGLAMDLPEFIQMTNQPEVREHSLQILQQLQSHRARIDALLETSLVDWQLHRLAQVDQNILRIAVTEILYLGIPDRVAINEAVELAKRYSGEEGHRFINGVLRRVINQLQKAQ